MMMTVRMILIKMISVRMIFNLDHAYEEDDIEDDLDNYDDYEEDLDIDYKYEDDLDTGIDDD
jgi:hypothetical protein